MDNPKNSNPNTNQIQPKDEKFQSPETMQLKPIQFASIADEEEEYHSKKVEKTKET